MINIRNKIAGASNNNVKTSSRDEKTANTRNKGAVNVNVRGFFIYKKRDQSRLVKTTGKLRVSIINKSSGSDY